MKQPLSPTVLSLPGTVETSPTGDLGELTTRIPGQASVFRIYGQDEVLADMAHELQALDARTPRMRRVTPKVAQVDVATVERPTATYELPSRRDRVTTWFADNKLRKFDKIWDTNLAQQKQEKRRKTAIFLMASEAELFDEDSLYYKRQLKNLTKV